MFASVDTIHVCQIVVNTFSQQKYFRQNIFDVTKCIVSNWLFFILLQTLKWDTQGMYKNRVKNDRKIFEIPALLSSQQGNPERENSLLYIKFWNFPTLDFLIWKIKEQEFQKSFFTLSLYYVHILIFFVSAKIPTTYLIFFMEILI